MMHAQKQLGILMLTILLGASQAYAESESGIIQSIHFGSHLVTIDGQSLPVAYDVIIHNSSMQGLYALEPGLKIRYELNGRKEVSEAWIVTSNKHPRMHLDDDTPPEMEQNK